jgi:hypothetical protein
MADNPQPTGATRKVRKAVLPAAGLGTRFLPATKAQPKEMLTVVDKPQIQYVVEECVASGIEHIIIVTGKGKIPSRITDHAPVLERFRGKREDGTSCHGPPDQRHGAGELHEAKRSRSTWPRCAGGGGLGW